MAAWNEIIFNWFFRFAHRSFFLDSFIVFLGEYLPYFLVLALGVLIFREFSVRRRWFYLCELALAALLSRGILTEVIRYFYHHPRPFDALGIGALIPESGSSLPSGHAAFLFALVGILFMIRPRWGWVYFGLALGNGLARIAAGVHWPLDILSGAALGLISAGVIHLLVRGYLPPGDTAKTEVS